MHGSAKKKKDHVDSHVKGMVVQIDREGSCVEGDMVVEIRDRVETVL